MLTLALESGEVHVWKVRLDRADVPPPTPGEAARAARFATPTLRRRYLRSHGALRAILGRYTDARLDFALHEQGKPYLPNSPRIQFNLSHSRDRAMVAVALDIAVGIDIERTRPLAEHAALAERFFPPSEGRPADAADFFRRWTRYEAILKAQGIGLYGAGSEPEGEWNVQELDAGHGFVAAVAAAGSGHTFVIHDYGETE